MKAAPSLSIIVIAMFSATGCGTAKLTGYDCPLATQLARGVAIECGGQSITGTVYAKNLAECSATGQTDCFATKAFAAVDQSLLVPENVKVGREAAGVTGNLEVTVIGGTFPLCERDGQTDCITLDRFVAIDTTTAADRIAAGVVVGSVTGTGVVANAVPCSSNAQVGCLANSTYVSAPLKAVSACLLTDP